MVERLEKIIFFLLIFFIPFQTRVFLFSADIVGGFNEWQSGFLYATDILILGLFGLWFFRARSKLVNLFNAATRLFRQIIFVSYTKNKNSSAYGGLKQLIFLLGSLFAFSIAPSRLRLHKPTILLLLGGLIFMSFISILFTSSALVAWYRWVKLVEAVGLFFYVGYIMRRGVRVESIALWFVLSGVLQGVVAIFQFIKQSSLGLKILGEAPLTVGADGVAHIYVAGERVMRAYGTFTNPNVLAAFLALALFFLFFLALSLSFSNVRYKCLTLVSLFVLLPALFITFSRFGIIIFYALSILYFSALIFLPRLRAYRISALRFGSVFFALSILFAAILHTEFFARFIANIAPGEAAISERLLFNTVALDLIHKHLGGIGMGNFTFVFREFLPGLRESLYQPVHNIFILLAVETGVVPALFFILFIAKVLGRSVRRFFASDSDILCVFTLILASIFLLLTGLFDHFYLTLQQGLLIFWLIFAMLNYYAFRR